jgi:hypothetical protein
MLSSTAALLALLSTFADGHGPRARRARKCAEPPCSPLARAPRPLGAWRFGISTPHYWSAAMTPSSSRTVRSRMSRERSRDASEMSAQAIGGCFTTI